MKNTLPEKEHVIVGTAGHIDHGKTALVKALTGIDADTLPEEKERGLTIELGFVFMEDPDYEKQIVFIDVPGHEKFVKTMAAGASNIDAVLLVIAADEGINVQTKEHFDVVRLLDISTGMIVLTKTDLVDRSRLDEVEEKVREFVRGTFLENAPILPVSSVTGSGIEQLRSALKELGRGKRKRQDRGVFRMPIDRVFVMHGFGTVIAGTVLSGEVHIGDRIEVYPERIPVRVRGIQVHKESREKSGIGKRTALNLQDIKKELLRRGQCAAAAGALEATCRLDARLYLLERYGKDLKNRERIRLHIGTEEVIARLALLDRGILKPGESAPVQFMLEAPTVALPQDRFVIRTFSPQMTIGGGKILDSLPAKHRRFDEKALEGIKRLEGSLENVVEEMFLKASFRPSSFSEVSRNLGVQEEKVRAAGEKLLEAEKLRRIDSEKHESFLHSESYRTLLEKLAGMAKSYLENNPHWPLVPFSALRSEFLKLSDETVFKTALDELCRKNILFKSESNIGVVGHEIRLSRKEQEAVNQIEQIFKKSGYAVPLEEDARKELGLSPESFRNIVKSLKDRKILVRLNDKVTYHRDSFQSAQETVVGHIKKKGSITIAELRDALNLSRKYAHALLEYFDRTGLTKRIEDRHVLK